MYLEDYLFQIDIDNILYNVRNFKKRFLAKEIPNIKKIMFYNIYLGGQFWARGSIDRFGYIIIFGQNLKIPLGGFQLDEGHKLRFRDCHFK